MESLIKDALGYARLGCFVFPCALDKKPMTAHGFQDATTDRAIIMAWWTEHPLASIGIACGATGWLVLDIDADKGGFESYAELRDKNILTPDDLETFTTRTGSGGQHIVWLAPEGVKIGNSTEGIKRFLQLGKTDVLGLDIRGDGGYIIAPPSGHPSGGTYRIERNAKPKPAPERLCELLIEAAPANSTAPIVIPKNLSRALQRSYERVANAPEGTRNETLNKAAFYLFGLVREQKLVSEEVRETMYAAGLRAGLAEREIRATLTSAWRGAMG